MRSFLQDVEPDGVDFVGSAANLRRFALLKAQWTTAFMNNLPDSSFAYIEPGGEKDSEGKTTPRSKRHLPYKDASGTVDKPHLRDALARLDQTDIPAAAKAAAKAKLEAAAKAAGVGGGDTSKSRNAIMTKLPKSEFVKRLAAQGLELELDDPKIEGLAKSLNFELTDDAAGDPPEPEPSPVEKSGLAKILKAIGTALGIKAEDTSPLDKSKLSPEAREYVAGLEKRLGAIETANMAAARVALTKRITALHEANWIEGEPAELEKMTEPEVAAIEKARDRVIERLKKAGVFSSFGTPEKTADEPTTLREMVHKAVVDQLGREPKNRTEEARVKKEVYDANPGLFQAVLREEREAKAQGAA